MHSLAYSTIGGIETALEPGDRVEIGADLLEECLIVPPELRLGGQLPEVLEDPQGKPLAMTVDASRSEIAVSGLRAILPKTWDAIWLEFREPGRFRLAVEEGLPHEEAEEFRTEQGVPIVSEPSDWSVVRGGLRDSATLPEVELALRAARLATHGGFDQLICLPLVREMELLEHQIRTAKTVLRRFRGRALLCDEVGLGKTIEAGIVLAELAMRGLVRSVLVLTPPSLVEQWQGEMRRKFSLDFISYDDPAFREAGPGGLDAASTASSPRCTPPSASRTASAILGRKWDMVIVDEAHHLRNRTTQAWRFASELQKQYMLLLTATPVQNNLDELFNLVTLLEPGLLSTAKQFQRQLRRSPRQARRRATWTSCTSCWPRSWSATGGARWVCSSRAAGPRRRAWPWRPAEAAALRRRDRIRPPAPARRRQRSGLNRDGAADACRWPWAAPAAAAAGTLETPGRAAPADRRGPRATGRDWPTGPAAQSDSSKARTGCCDLLGEFPDKMVIFTQFRATQEMLAPAAARGRARRGRVPRRAVAAWRRKRPIARFRGPARLLLSTESGSEGRNLQFAHARAATSTCPGTR